jgi:hypothetical protein
MRPDESGLKPDRSPVFFGYLLGVLTATIIFLIIAGWIVYGIGFSNVVKNFNHIVFPWVKQKVVDIPDSILKELTALSAGIENANNPTNLTPHDTIFVSPDKELGHKIKPNVTVSANILMRLSVKLKLRNIRR